MRSYQFPHYREQKWIGQAKRVFASLYQSPKTRLQLANSLGVPLQNVCRYVGHMKRAGSVTVVKIDKDPLSRQQAEYLSTNPIHFPKGQLKMFSDARTQNT